MTQSFADLFEQSIDNIELKSGSLIDAKVVEIGKDFVVITAGLKSDGYIPITEFTNYNGEVTVSVGDTIEVSLEAVEDGFGETKFSYEKAQRAKAWKKLEGYLESQETVKGVVTGKVKGGCTVDLGDIRAFLPGSLLDVRPVKDMDALVGQEIEFKIIKLDEKRNNVVISRRAVLESEYQAEREALLKNLKEGDIVKGIVKNLTDYGVFIDLGGVDGLLHITDMSWKRVRYPSEIVNIGDEIEVKVLRFEEDKNRVSLGLKQMHEDPWISLANKYQEGSKVSGKVTNIADYGCFVEIEDGIEGLVHVSEMDWTNKNVNPKKFVSVGQEVEVVVLDIDSERRRISLGMKQCQENPWTAFKNNYGKNQIVSGAIKSITDFGVFIGLDGGIDGLIHLSDLSWTLPGEEAVKAYTKGQEIEAVVLAIDSERERISLGIKQLETDSFGEYLQEHPKGTVVKGVVTEVNATEALIELTDSVKATLRVSEFSKDRTEDLTTELKVGDEVEAKIINIDRKAKQINLSIKAKEFSEEKETIKEYMRGDSSSSGTSLGDIFKELKND